MTIEMVVALAGLVAALGSALGIYQQRRKYDADAAGQAFKLAQDAMTECSRLKKRLDAAYTRIDELKERERELMTELAEQKTDYEKKIAKLEAKVELLAAQLLAADIVPITGLDSDPDIELKEG